MPGPQRPRDRIGYLKLAPQVPLRLQPVLIAALVLLLRVPFLNQAIQGDDQDYLAGAMHAQIDPLHPTRGDYVYLGREVDLRGHPHPPLNMWLLGGLLALFGDIREVPFHSVYAVFSLIAALSMWSLARRFSPSPLWATMLFLAVPAFVVNGNSLESDIPFLAFWMAAVALFVRGVDGGSRRLVAAAVACLAPAALAAYQSLLLIPIGALYLWQNRRGFRSAWAALATPVVLLGSWQLFERLSAGALPAAVLADHFEGYGLQALTNKLRSAAALTVHLGWMVFPVLAAAAFDRAAKWVWIPAVLGAGAGAVFLDPHPLFWIPFGAGLLILSAALAGLRRGGEGLFLSAWLLMFFGAALALFFAGSARYLLPVAAPLCLLVTRPAGLRRGWLAAGFAPQMLLSLALAVVNYQHWDGYRAFVAGLAPLFEQRRVWINGEWGLRFYAEAHGGLPLRQGQAVQPDEVVVSSELAYPSSFTTGGGVPAVLAEAAIEPAFPLRLIGLGARSAYSAVVFGYRAFDWRPGPLDRVSARLIVAREPELSFLPMNAPQAETQIVSGIHKLEDNAWRWMAARGAVLLKAPPAPAVLEASVYIPENAPVREIVMALDGRISARQAVTGPGALTLRSSGPVAVEGSRATVEITVDRTFSPPGDRRELGLVLISVGFAPQ